MTNQEIIEQLKPLLSIRELDMGFESQGACIDWANKVAPLLKFDAKHYEDFQEPLRQINVIGLSAELQGSNLNTMISIARQAIFELENNISTPISPTTIDMPEKITIPWLLHNVPVSMWFKFAGILLFIFTLGLYASTNQTITSIMKYLPGYKAPITISDTKKSDNKIYELKWTNSTGENQPPDIDIPINIIHAKDISVEGRLINASNKSNRLIKLEVLTSALEDGNPLYYHQQSVRNDGSVNFALTPKPGFMWLRLHVSKSNNVDFKAIVSVTY